MPRRRISITIEKRQLFVAPASQAMEREVCPACNVEVNMLPAVMAARVAGVSHRTLYRWIEEDRVHYRELSDGAVLVCEKSLLRNNSSKLIDSSAD